MKPWWCHGNGQINWWSWMQPLLVLQSLIHNRVGSSSCPTLQGGQEGFAFLAQSPLPAASLLQERAALASFVFEGGCEELFDLSPSLRFHALLLQEVGGASPHHRAVGC